MEKTVAKAVGQMIGMIIGFLVRAYILYYFWPLVMVETFHLPALDFQHAMVLLVVVHMFFPSNSNAK